MHNISVADAAFYAAGMTVAFMGFALDPLIACYESVNTAGKKHSNSCEEGGTPGHDLVSMK